MTIETEEFITTEFARTPEVIPNDRPDQSHVIDLAKLALINTDPDIANKPATQDKSAMPARTVKRKLSVNTGLQGSNNRRTILNKNYGYRGPEYIDDGQPIPYETDISTREDAIKKLLEQYGNSYAVKDAIEMLGKRPTITEMPESSYDLYLRKLRRFGVLDTDDVTRLFKVLEKGIYAHLHNNGDEKSKIDAVIARQVVFLSNLRLVIGYARKYYKSPLPIDDLTQEGNIGLAKAIDHYDYRRKVKFSTYATWWIWQAIVRADRHLGRKIRLPEHVHDIRVQLYKAADRLYTRNSREPSPEEIAEEIDHPVEYVLENMSFQEPLSLNENVDYESGLERGQLIEDVTDVENETLEAIDNDDIMHIIFNESGLTLAEQFILSMRRGIPVEGLKGEKIVISRQFKGQHISREIIYENWLAKIILEDGLTLETIGEIFGVTRERIRQKENDILEKLHGLKALSDRR